MSDIALQIERSAAGSVSAGANVIYNTVVYSAGNISYNSVTGIITFNEAGRYVVNWWAATKNALSANGVIFALLSSQGDYLEGNSPIKAGEVYGTGIIDVAAAPVTLSLINASTGTTYYATQLPLTATLVIIEDDPGASVAKFGYVYNPTNTETAIEQGSDFIFQNNGPLNGISHTAGTTQIIVPEAGNYQIEYTVVLTNNTDAIISIAVNGTVVSSTSVPTQSVLGEFSDSAILALAAGDSVTLRVT